MIWFVQVVHYPLFDDVARRADLVSYQVADQRRTSRVEAIAALVVAPGRLGS